MHIVKAIAVQVVRIIKYSEENTGVKAGHFYYSHYSEFIITDLINVNKDFIQHIITIGTGSKLFLIT